MGLLLWSSSTQLPACMCHSSSSATPAPLQAARLTACARRCSGRAWAACTRASPRPWRDRCAACPDAWSVCSGCTHRQATCLHTANPSGSLLAVFLPGLSFRLVPHLAHAQATSMRRCSSEPPCSARLAPPSGGWPPIPTAAHARSPRQTTTKRCAQLLFLACRFLPLPGHSAALRYLDGGLAGRRHACLWELAYCKHGVP